jgi:hypothetical protein
VFAKTLAKTLGCSVEEAQHFIDVWFKAHPLVKEWHRRIFNEMKGRKYIENRFGGRKQFYDTTDHGTALSEALAWIPQSTVAIVINKVWDYITDNADPRILRVCMQVHDSLCFNIKLGHLEEALYIIKKAFDSVIVPYDDPLVIGSSMAVRANWGHVEDISWDGYLIDDDTGHVTNPENMMTTMEGVFAGGDIVRGPEDVINAIAQLSTQKLFSPLDTLFSEFGKK